MSHLAPHSGEIQMFLNMKIKSAHREKDPKGGYRISKKKKKIMILKELISTVHKHLASISQPSNIWKLIWWCDTLATPYSMPQTRNIICFCFFFFSINFVLCFLFISLQFNNSMRNWIWTTRHTHTHIYKPTYMSQPYEPSHRKTAG